MDFLNLDIDEGDISMIVTPVLLSYTHLGDSRNKERAIFCSFAIAQVDVIYRGNSVWTLRSPSVLGATGLVSLGAGPVRRLFGNRTAFIYVTS